MYTKFSINLDEKVDHTNYFLKVKKTLIEKK